MQKETRNHFEEAVERDRREVEEKRQAQEPYRDKIRGSLLGGAVGDALGYPVEFSSWSEIQRAYGEKGIQDYTLDDRTGFALLSDDTQMTLFTADGILIYSTRGHLRGIAGAPGNYVYNSYLNWLATQGLKGREAIETRWRSRLELADVILEIADDLCDDCPLSEYRRGQDPAWESIFIHGRRSSGGGGERHGRMPAD